jgi:hypothetical protein
MNHAERIGGVIRDMEIALETGDMTDALENGIDILGQIQREILADDEVRS